MNLRSLPIALTVRPDGEQFVLLLGDGRFTSRFARMAVDHAVLLADSQAAREGSEPARLNLWRTMFPGEVGAWLLQAPPCELDLLLPAVLDPYAWELAGADGSALGQRWAMSRHLLFDDGVVADDEAPAPRSDPLRIVAVGADTAGLADLDGPHGAVQFVRFDPGAPLSAAAALDDVDVALLDAGAAAAVSSCLVQLLRAPRLTITIGADAATQQLLARALPCQAGALWCLDDIGADIFQGLLRHLTTGSPVAHAVRDLHASPATAASVRCARLYGMARQPLVRPGSVADRSANLRQVTTLSLDLVDSTGLLQRLGDERYSQLLFAFHAECAAVVRQHGGRADDPQGDDGVMCYFGYPQASETAAERAVLAGLQLAQAVQHLEVMVRIGIATGRVAIRDAQPVGLSIHLAARLQGVASAGSVLVAESTHALVRHRFQMMPLERSLALKGIAGLSAAYRVLHPLSASDTAAISMSQAMTPFVGRDAEMDTLHGQWQRALQGHLQATLVLGEPGIGKSRLVFQFAQRLAAEGGQSLYCRAQADLQGTAFGALNVMLRKVFDLQAGDDAAVQRRKIVDTLPDKMSDGDALPLLAGLLSIDGAAALSSSAKTQRERTLSLLCDWVRLEVHQRPTCLVVEDAHWLDPSTRELLHRLLAEPEGVALMLLATQRSSTDSPWEPVASHQTLQLQGLPPGAARRLARQACGERPLPPDVLRLLALRSDGVPLFLEESVEMALESGLGEAGVPQALRMEVPATLQDLLMARLDRLGPARGIAHVGAALGRHFPQPLLRAVLLQSGEPGRADDMVTHLRQLQRSGLLRRTIDAGEVVWTFKHALVRDTAYQALWERDRQQLHRHVATVLEQQFPALVQRQPEMLARHQTLAGLHEQALAQWERAARSAAAASAHEEAIAHIDNALLLLPGQPPGPSRDAIELRLCLLLASRCIATDGYGASRVERLYARAAALCQQLGDDAALLKVELGRQGWFFMRGDLEQARAIADRCRQATEHSAEPMQRLQADWALAVTRFHQGEAVPAVALMDRILQAYRPAMHRPGAVQDPAVMSLCYSAWAQWELGHVDDALRRVQRVVELAERLKHRFSLAEAYGFAASVHLFRGETDAGLDCARRAIEVCDSEGFAVWHAHAMVMRGSLRCAAGSVEQGLADMAEGVSMWVATGAVVTLPMYLSLHAEGLARAGRIDDALVQLQRAQTLIGTHGEHYHEAEVRRLRGELLLQRGAARALDGCVAAAGDVAAAEACLQSALDLAIAQQKSSFALRASVALARHWLACDQPARAARRLESALAEIEGGEGTADAQSAKLLMRQAVQRANITSPRTP